MTYNLDDGFNKLNIDIKKKGTWLSIRLFKATFLQEALKFVIKNWSSSQDIDLSVTFAK